MASSSERVNSITPMGRRNFVGHADSVHLLTKYREMQRLRVAQSDGTLPDPREAMRELARQFPGALRELDEMPFDEIVRRVDHLAAVEELAQVPEPWVEPVTRYHAWLRRELDVRRASLLPVRRGRMVARAVAELASELAMPPEALRLLLFPYSVHQQHQHARCGPDPGRDRK